MNEQKSATEQMKFEKWYGSVRSRYDRMEQWTYNDCWEAWQAALAQREKPTNAYTWRSPETAPNSGEPFLWKVDIHVVKGHLWLPDEIRHHAEVVRRSRSSMDSDGYWMGEYRSIPDMEFNSGKWMPLSVKKK